ncbi:MAG: hypothetical protein KDD58_15315 [Bdellovibrionales bacterium]|nr:hypothetical protein [Bdellovibrionales bacterium]
MKFKIFFLIMFFLSSNIVDATESEQGEKLKTNLSFDELLIQGKYHFSDEAVVTVEDDKILDALLPVRKDFKDRVKRSASRH